MVPLKPMVHAFSSSIFHGHAAEPALPISDVTQEEAIVSEDRALVEDTGSCSVWFVHDVGLFVSCTLVDVWNWRAKRKEDES